VRQYFRCAEGANLELLYVTDLKTRNYVKKWINRLTPNDAYSGRTAPLTSKRCILYICSKNIGTEYFKHGIYAPFFLFKTQFVSLILKYLVPVLFTFYIQSLLKLKK